MSHSRLGGFENSNMSCYLDSLLMSLLYEPNHYIDNHILNVNLNQISIPKQLLLITYKIQQSLKFLQEIIWRGKIMSCDVLRQLFDLYQMQSNDYLINIGKKPNKIINWLTEQKSPHDVLAYIEKIFNVKYDAYRDFRIIVKDNEKYITTLSETRKSDVIIHIDSFMLAEKKEINITDIVNSITTTNLSYNNLYKKKYSQKMEYNKLLRAPILIFSVDRNYMGNKPNTRVISPEYIDLDKQLNQLHLSSIIVHDGSSPNGGHFRTYLKHGTYWYEYNDINYQHMKYVGQFSDLDDYVFCNATQFFYY